MRRISYRAVILACFLAWTALTGVNADPARWVSASWGSLRTPYAALSSVAEGAWYPFEFRLESFGTPFLVGSGSFDLEAAALLGFGMFPLDLLWSWGPGILVEARLGNDVRSTARTGGAPFVRLEAEGNWPGGLDGTFWGIRMPFDVAVYRNGAAVTVVSELRWGFPGVFLQLQEKNRWLAGAGSALEYRWDTYLGLGFGF